VGAERVMILVYFSSKGYRGPNRWRAGGRDFFFPRRGFKSLNIYFLCWRFRGYLDWVRVQVLFLGFKK
jgi:hypothetical protein